MKQRTLALAGVFQATELVRQAANHGHRHPARGRTGSAQSPGTMGRNSILRT